MSMEKTIIYLKAEQSSYVDHKMIYIGDVASVYCGDKKKEEEIRNIILYEFDENKEKEGRIFLSILFIIEKISSRFHVVKFAMWENWIWLCIISLKMQRIRNGYRQRKFYLSVPHAFLEQELR